jgi:Flp pilus assembly protein TadD
VLLGAVAVAQDAEDYFRRGSKLFSDHQADAALNAFRQSVHLRPDYAAAWKAIGVILASRGDYESAQTAFRNACERQPSLPDACLYYGRTLYLLNRFQPAIDVLRRTTQAETRNAEAFRLLGLSLEGAGDTVAAGDVFRQALRLPVRGSADEDPGIDYGVYLFRQGRAEQALAPLEDALKRHPNAGRAHLELGCVLLALDRVDDAASHLERAVALDPASARAHLLLGKAYLRLGKAEAAEEHLRQGSRTVR